MMHNSTEASLSDNDRDILLLLRPSAGVEFFTVILWALTIAVGVVGNILLSLTIGCSSSLRTAMNMYVLSIALVDLMTCAVLLPLRLLAKKQISKGVDPSSMVYGAELFMRTFTEIARLFLMQSLSVERYQAIARPFSVSKVQARRRAVIISGGICGVAVVISVVSVKFFCDSVLYGPCVNHATGEMTKWGDLEVYVEMPLTLLSVLAIAISYSLIVIVLRQQRKKMNRHSKPKINQVAPLAKDNKGAGSSGNSGTKMTFLGVHDNNDNHSKAGLAGEVRKGHDTDEASTLKTNTVACTESVLGSGEYGSKVDTENKNTKEFSQVGSDGKSHPCQASTESLAVDVSDRKKDKYIDGGAKDTQSIQSKVVEDTDSNNFQRGSSYVKKYDKSLMDISVQPSIAETVPKVQRTNKALAVRADTKEVQCSRPSDLHLVKSDLSSTALLSSSLSSVLSFTSSVLTNLAVKSSSNMATRALQEGSVRPQTARDFPAPSRVKSFASNQFSSEQEAKIKHVCSANEPPSRFLRGKLGTAMTPFVGVARIGVGTLMKQIQVRSFSSPMLMSDRRILFEDECWNKNSCHSFVRKAVHIQGDSTCVSTRPRLCRSKTEGSNLYGDKVINFKGDVPHYTVVKTGSMDTADSRRSKEDLFHQAVFDVGPKLDSHDKLDLGHDSCGTPHDRLNDYLQQNKAEVIFPPGKGSGPSKNTPLNFTHKHSVDRRISTDSQGQNHDVDKDGISLKFDLLNSCSEEDEQPDSPKSHKLSTVFLSLSAPNLAAATSEPNVSWKSISDFSDGISYSHQVEGTESSHKKKFTETDTEDKENVAPLVTVESPQDDTQGNLQGHPENDHSKTSPPAMDEDQVKTCPTTDTTDCRKVEVVDMDGTVHVQILKNEVSSAPIEGAVCLMNPRNKEQGRRRVELKAALKVGLSFCCFVCLWMPFPISVLVMRGTESWNDLVKVNILTVFSALATSTAAVDPILYGLLNRQIRHAAQAEWRKVRRKVVTYFIH